eukprot:Selendium_serpulae@DN6046_c0_g2_i3.p1
MSYSHQTPVRHSTPSTDVSPASSIVSPDPLVRSASVNQRIHGGVLHTPPPKWGVDHGPYGAHHDYKSEGKGGSLMSEKKTGYRSIMRWFESHRTAIQMCLFSLVFISVLGYLFKTKGGKIRYLKSSSLTHLSGHGGASEGSPSGGLGLRSGVRLFDWNPANEKLVKRNRIKKLHVLFYDSSDPHATDIEDAFGEVAAQFYRQAILHVRVKREFMRDFQFFLPEDPETLVPFSVIVEANHGFRKYRFPTDPASSISPPDPANYRRSLSQQLASFEEEYFAGGLRSTPWLRSEQAYNTDEQDGSNVLQLVGSQFQSDVVKGRHDALVFFYAPWYVK